MRSSDQAAAQTITQLQRIDMELFGLAPGRRRIDGLPAIRGQERVLGGDERASAIEAIEAPLPQPGLLAAEHTVDATSAAENGITRLGRFRSAVGDRRP